MAHIVAAYLVVDLFPSLKEPWPKHLTIKPRP